MSTKSAQTHVCVNIRNKERMHFHVGFLFVGEGGGVCVGLFGVFLCSAQGLNRSGTLTTLKVDGLINYTGSGRVN